MLWQATQSRPGVLWLCCWWQVRKHPQTFVTTITTAARGHFAPRTFCPKRQNAKCLGAKCLLADTTVQTNLAKCKIFPQKQKTALRIVWKHTVLSRIYVFTSVKFLVLKLRLCKKRQIRGMETFIKWVFFIDIKTKLVVANLIGLIMKMAMSIVLN